MKLPLPRIFYRYPRAEFYPAQDGPSGSPNPDTLIVVDRKAFYSRTVKPGEDKSRFPAPGERVKLKNNRAWEDLGFEL